MEYIKEAAIRLDNDLFTGKHHGACLAKLKSGSQQGFLTQLGRFVTREQALIIAESVGQTIHKYPGKPLQLLSEDLNEDSLFIGGKTKCGVCHATVQNIKLVNSTLEKEHTCKY